MARMEARVGIHSVSICLLDYTGRQHGQSAVSIQSSRCLGRYKDVLVYKITS